MTRIARLLLVICVSFQSAAFAETPTVEQLRSVLNSDRYEELKPFGGDAIEPLLNIYRSGNIADKTRVASALYYLSIKSESARQLLLNDVHTEDPNLRMQVQWALGRVSSNESVVRVLLQNMRNDPNPLFRDKAACALANDQVHLTEAQRVLMLEGLVEALNDEKNDVRRIALLALQIQTGQTKDYNPNASLSERSTALERWRNWVKEYRANVTEAK